jgi:acyl-CoA synthetase (AMP-forming)/AMP-acid ligase II
MFKNLGNIILPNCDLDKIAVIDLSKATQSYSYRQIDQKSDAVARSLLSKNIKIGDKISILADNSVDFISVFFGSMRLGAIPVLINTKLTDLQINTILTDTESKLLFTDQNKEFNLETVQFDNNFENFLNYGNFNCYEPNDDDVAFIMYTSGSHGNPKGVLLTHKNHIWGISRNINNDVKWADRRISLISAPLYHTNGITTFEGCFARQSIIVLLPKFDPIKCIQAIETYQVNLLFCVPTMLSMMIQEENIKTADLSSVEQIRSASSHLSGPLINLIKQYFPKANIRNSYGLTEVGPALFGPHPDGIPSPSASVGYPVQGIQYRIINEILEVKSPSMMKSYNNSNQDSFTADGYFITKDMFRIDQEGFYYFLGRSDDMFKCGGNSVYPSQVEEILESHPCVVSAVVLGLEDNIKGYKPYAFVIIDKNSTVSEEELKKYVLDRGPAYQHPRKICFIKEFPWVGGIKIDQQKLKQLLKNH